jgi:hypothetical protein
MMNAVGEQTCMLEMVRRRVNIKANAARYVHHVLGIEKNCQTIMSKDVRYLLELDNIHKQR